LQCIGLGRYNNDPCTVIVTGDFNSLNTAFLEDDFVNVILILMSQCIPARVVRLGKRDPSFVTPLVRMLLNRRRRLRRRGHLTAANAVAEKNDHIISRVQSESLTDVTSQSTRKLWAAVNFKYRDTIPTNSKLITADRLNEFFAKISTGTPVDPGVYHSGALHSSSDISEYEIERILRGI